MPLTPGTRLGPYEILAAIGAGGMGEVYRARDTKLNRDVALKVLPQATAGDPERLRRFEREAQVLAALNHPHIAAIYGIEGPALVMEFVDGETLGGPISVEEALAVARQIAEALEYAHDKGIIHRDLKPANVKVTPEGIVKVLDFGLAKALVEERSDPGFDNSPTLSLAATKMGMILGTAAYMAPEQARGAAVDKRADIWAFGCVLYELLSGHRMFQGDSTSDVLAAVLRADPDWNALPSETPESVRRLLKRCLEKDRKRRLPAIGVARLEIDDALSAPEPATPPAQPAASTPLPAHSKRAGVLAAILAAAVVLLTIAVAALWFSRPAVPEVWSGTMLGGPVQAMFPRLSPDGQMLAFIALVDKLPQVAVMKPNGGSWTILTKDRENGAVGTVAWAPDGSKIYFDRQWGYPMGIYSIPPLGGEPRLLLDAAFAPEPLPDGSLIVAKLTEVGDDQLFHFWPDTAKLEALPAFSTKTDVALMLRASPDGKELVYFGTGEKDRSQSPHLSVFDLSTKQSRELATGLRVLGGPWWPVDIAPDAKSVYAIVGQGDACQLMRIPRQPGATPQALLSFPSLARPISMDATPDGSIYADLYSSPAAILRFNVSGSGIEESPMPPPESSGVVPGGDVLAALTAGGKGRLVAVRPGGEPRTLVETTESTGFPATLFGGNVGFVIGSGDQRRLAIASLRDGHVVRRFSTTASVGLVAAPDGNTLYYSFNGGVWAQAVAGGDPKRIADGIDVTLDPQGQHLYVKHAKNGVLGITRMTVAGGDPQELSVPAEYAVANPDLAAAAVDARGRILVSVLPRHGFYYETALLDPASKSFTVLPVAFDGDVKGAGWAPDGRILAQGSRYLLSLWRYQPSKALR